MAGLATLLIQGAHALHLLRPIERPWRDLMAEVDRKKLGAPVAVISITDDEFHDASLFRGVSPLAPDILRRIVEAAAAHQPRGIVLDVLIHPPVAEDPQRIAAREKLYASLDSLADFASVPLVLVRDLASERIERPSDLGAEESWGRLLQNERLNWADPGILQEDGRVRAVPLASPGHGEIGENLPSLLDATIRACRLTPMREMQQTDAEEAHGVWNVRFTGEFLRAHGSVTSSRLDAKTILSTSLVPGQSSLLRDKVLLIGGTYQAGRDTHATAVGEMAGVYIWAEAVASWIRQDALREPPTWIVLLLEFLLGILTGLLLERFGPVGGLIAGLGIVVPLALVSSVATFGDHSLFVNFLPACVAVFIHYQIETQLKLKKLERLEHRS